MRPRARTTAPFLAVVASLFVASARAATPSSVLVFVPEGHTGLAVRLGAELAALDYEAVPLSPVEAEDGDSVASALRSSGARAALTLAETDDGLEACVTVAATLEPSCRHIAESKEHLSVGATATRAVELLRARLLELSDPQQRPQATTGPSPPPPPAEAQPSPRPPERHPLLATHVGPGVLVTPGGVPAALTVDVGADWLSLSPFALGLHAAIPVNAPTVARSEGAAAVRCTVVDGSVALSRRRGVVHGALGVGGGVAWVQVDGAASAPYEGRADSMVVPVMTAKASGAVSLDERVAIRADLMGGYTLGTASIRFGGVETATVGRPLLEGALSLELSWP